MKKGETKNRHKGLSISLFPPDQPVLGQRDRSVAGTRWDKAPGAEVQQEDEQGEEGCSDPTSARHTTGGQERSREAQLRDETPRSPPQQGGGDKDKHHPYNTSQPLFWGAQKLQQPGSLPFPVILSQAPFFFLKHKTSPTTHLFLNPAKAKQGPGSSFFPPGAVAAGEAGRQEHPRPPPRSRERGSVGAERGQESRLPLQSLSCAV